MLLSSKCNKRSVDTPEEKKDSRKNETQLANELKSNPLWLPVVMSREKDKQRKSGRERKSENMKYQLARRRIGKITNSERNWPFFKNWSEFASMVRQHIVINGPENLRQFNLSNEGKFRLKAISSNYDPWRWFFSCIVKRKNAKNNYHFWWTEPPNANQHVNILFCILYIKWAFDFEL